MPCWCLNAGLTQHAHVLQARAQAAKQSVDKVIKRTPKAPKKRKLRDEPTHLRFESKWSDTETSESAGKKQKKQVSALVFSGHLNNLHTFPTCDQGSCRDIEGTMP